MKNKKKLTRGPPVPRISPGPWTGRSSRLGLTKTWGFWLRRGMLVSYTVNSRGGSSKKNLLKALLKHSTVIVQGHISGGVDSRTLIDSLYVEFSAPKLLQRDMAKCKLVGG